MSESRPPSPRGPKKNLWRKCMQRQNTVPKTSRVINWLDCFPKMFVYTCVPFSLHFPFSLSQFQGLLTFGIFTGLRELLQFGESTPGVLFWGAGTDPSPPPRVVPPPPPGESCLLPRHSSPPSCQIQTGVYSSDGHLPASTGLCFGRKTVDTQQKSFASGRPPGPKKNAAGRDFAVEPRPAVRRCAAGIATLVGRRPGATLADREGGGGGLKLRGRHMARH